MTDWFSVIAAGSALPAEALNDLRDVGFVVTPGPADDTQIEQLAGAYDSAVAAASPEDANVSAEPRRSIQGAFIRREAPSGVDWPGRMRADTLARIGPLAKYVLAV
jgi:hypothetical protein